jgi:hypothetical protein
MKDMLVRTTTGFALGVAVLFAGEVRAEELTKSGTGTIHSAYKGTGTITEVAEKRLHWVGTWSGVSFNDEGRGFLHRMAWNCPAVTDIDKGAVSVRGLCVLTDAEGHKIHGSWVNQASPGAESLGKFDIAGGTGKYAGIEGQWDIRCISITPDSVTCRQKYSYRIP